eukprot:jgi/Mesvir1/280/Mv13614-RA.2
MLFRNSFFRRWFCGDRNSLGYERTQTDGSEPVPRRAPPVGIPPTHKLAPQIFFLFIHLSLAVLLLVTNNRFLHEWQKGEYTHDITFLVLWVWTVLQFCYLVNANPGFAALAPMARRDYKRRLSIPSSLIGQDMERGASGTLGGEPPGLHDGGGAQARATGEADLLALRPPAAAGMAKDLNGTIPDALSPVAASTPSVELSGMNVDAAAYHVAADLETWPQGAESSDPLSYPADPRSPPPSYLGADPRSPPASYTAARATSGSPSQLDGVRGPGPGGIGVGVNGGMMNGVPHHAVDVRSPVAPEVEMDIPRDEWGNPLDPSDPTETVAISLADETEPARPAANGGDGRTGGRAGGAAGKTGRHVRLILPDNRVRIPGEDSAKSVDAKGKSPFSPTHQGGVGGGGGGGSSRLATRMGLAGADSDEDALAFLQEDARLMSERPWEIKGDGVPRGSSNRIVNSRFIGVSPWRKQEASIGRSCPYCRLWQPLRAKHCHECNACVYRFDHHCFWIGGCVGQANHGKFWVYLLLQVLTSIWMFYIFVPILEPRRQFGEWLAINSFYLTLMLIGGMMLLFITGLFLFHTFLLLTNQTTWEVASTQGVTYMSGVPDNVRPFSLGVFRNIRQFARMGHAAPIIYQIPSQAELARRAETSSLCDNQYYSCC